MTDANGRFSFSNLPAGDYRVLAARQGFQTAVLGATGVSRPAHTIVLAAGEARNDLVLKLLPSSAISGTVLDDLGDPLRHCQVHLLNRTWSRGKPSYTRVMTVQTDDRGEYRAFNVMTGTYLVMAKAPPSAIVPQPNAQEFYAAQFYGGADRIDKAAPVVVRPGQELRGIDFRLQFAKNSSLRGRVTGLPNDARGNLILFLASRDLQGQDNSPLGYSQDPQNHTFEFKKVPSGSYTLTARFESAGPQYGGAVPLDVNGGETLETTIPLSPAIDLPGSLRIEGEPVEKRPPQVRLTPEDQQGLFSSPPAVDVGPDGKFVLKGVLPGVWDISVTQIPKGGYVKSMMLGKRDVLTKEMVIGPGIEGPLQIVISTRGASVSGEVENASATNPAYVLLAPQGDHAGVFTFFRSTMTDSQGKFKFTGLHPGSYRLYGLDELKTGAWQDPEFLKTYRERSTEIEVKEGEAITSKVQFIRSGGQ
jgi:protocatechuate 3,4-dioxygenase beta subunit